MNLLKQRRVLVIIYSEVHMNRFINYIKSEYKVIIFAIYSIIVFSAIFLFANLEKEYLVLGIEGILFGVFLYLFIQWFNYYKKEGYREIAEQLKLENKQLQSQALNDRRNLEEYFLLWVHQIKTPITVANLILQKDSSLYNKKLKAQMFYIEEYTNMAINYLKLIDRQADMDITFINLDKIIKNLLKKYSMMFIEKGISLKYEPINVEVISDAKWLAVLIEQILSNAIKYTESGTIKISYEEKANTMSIQDTGIGIRSEDLEKIFDRGYSGFNGRINEKSSGLGLYLAKSIAELINVKVKVESKINVGSKFIVQFPSNLSEL